MKKLLLSILASGLVLTSGCGNATNLVPPLPPVQAQPTAPALTQVEFLARPGIGEALLFTNDLLNTYNAVTPRFVNTALTQPDSAEAAAAAPIFEQATTVLDILENADGDPNNGFTTAQIVGAFLPDVMRIQTSGATADGFVPTGVDNPSYGTLNSNGDKLAYGRKLTDDVVDITLFVLTDGVPALSSDNVGYYPIVGNEAVGHQNLNGQNVPHGPATFPYLAPPN